VRLSPIPPLKRHVIKVGFFLEFGEVEDAAGIIYHFAPIGMPLSTLVTV
jgi:hypothetical protein